MMRKRIIGTFVLAVMLVCGGNVCAQNYDDGGERMRMSYKFDDGRLDWSEYAEKSKTVVIDGDRMVLTCRKDKEDVLSVARLPLYPRDNFKLGYNMTVPKLDEKHFFGVVFNYQDEDNYNCVLFDNKKFYYVTRENGAMYTEKKGAVKFKGKRNVEVSVTLLHIGNKLKVNVNNMEIYERTDVRLRHRFFGFYTSGKSSLIANGISFEQNRRDGSDD